MKQHQKDMLIPLVLLIAGIGSCGVLARNCIKDGPPAALQDQEPSIEEYLAREIAYNETVLRFIEEEIEILVDELDFLEGQYPFLPGGLEDLRVPFYDEYYSSVCYQYMLAEDAITTDKTVALCQNEINYLLVYNTSLDAEDVYNTWVAEAAKIGRVPEKDHRVLSVSILDSKSVDVSHYCTKFGRH